MNSLIWNASNKYSVAQKGLSWVSRIVKKFVVPSRQKSRWFQATFFGSRCKFRVVCVHGW